MQVYYKLFCLSAAITSRKKEGHLFLLARREQELVGAIECSKDNRLLLNFVKPTCFRQGISTHLVKHLLLHAKADILTNAHESALGFYKALGFQQSQKAFVQEHLRFFPLVYKVV